jgi:hypothetical protein
MATKAKSTHHINVVRDTEAMTVTFSLVEKATEKVIDTLVLKWSDVHEDSRNAVILYGLTTFPRDRTSQNTDVLTKLAAYQTICEETIFAGLWKVEGRKQGKRLTVLQTEVLAKHYKTTLANIEKSWKKLEESKKLEILESEAVVKLIAAATKKVQEVEDVSFDDLT